MALGSTQPLTEMSTRNVSWGVKSGRPAREADSLLRSVPQNKLTSIAVIQISSFLGAQKVGLLLPSPEGGNTCSFREVVLSNYLDFWTLDKVHKPSILILEH
jgi:hypothetical protein